MIGLLGPGITIFLILFFACLIFLYVISIHWAKRDAAERGYDPKKAMLISLIPFAGVLAYVLKRPALYLVDKEEQDLDIALKRRQLAEFGRCSNCGQPVKENYLICPKCQLQLKEKCDNCGKALKFSWKACPYCGHPKGLSSAFAAPEKSTKKAEKPKTQTAKKQKPKGDTQKTVASHVATTDK